MGEVRLRYTLWRLADEPSLWEPQRLYPRLRGVAFGVELGLDARSEARPWGAYNPAAFAPVDLRNTPSRTIWSARQWLRAGFTVHPRVRVQVDETASWMDGADDLVRLRVGGLNPYSVPLVRRAVGRLPRRASSPPPTSRCTCASRARRRVGVLVDGVALDDAFRTGGPTARPAVLAGIGAFADLRVGAWQIDLRGGWSPTLRSGTVAGGYTLWASFGRGWLR